MSNAQPGRSVKRLIAGAALALVLTTVWVFDPFAESLPDFRTYDAGPARKAAFVTYLQPLIEAENELIAGDRAKLSAIAAKTRPNWFDVRWLQGLAGEYEMDADGMSIEALLRELLLRVDGVPTSLALAQAAKESGWGTSRFAVEGNSLYGEWCFSAGCGIVPGRRADELSHEVRSFRTPQDSLRSYLRNINTHDSYVEFRAARKRHREADTATPGLALAGELLRYSEREDAYVRDIRNLIIFNNLHNDQAIPGAPE